MKKLALGLMAASAAVFGFGLVASAAGYDPALSVNPASPAPGGAYTVTYENCYVGETIVFTQVDSTPAEVTGECLPVDGVALLSVVALVAAPPALGVAVGEFDEAPTDPGVYNGTGAGAPSQLQSPELPFQFEITGATETTPSPVDTSTTTTVASGGQLPETGSNGIGTTTGIALGLFAAGLGMLIVAQVRRRQAPTTT